MIRALKFRRKLGEAGAVVTVVLCLAFYFAFRSASQAEGMNLWVAHTQRTLGLIGRAQLERSRLTNDFWAYRATHDQDLPPRFQSDVHNLHEDVDKLQALTADNSQQQRILTEIGAILAVQAAVLEKGMEQAGSPASLAPGSPLDWSTRTQPSDRLHPLFDSLEANERVLLARRSAAVQANARQTQVVLLLAGLLTVIILLVTGHLIQREILLRAVVEKGLRRARDLLGVQCEEQRVELSYAMEDLHAQIRVRQQAEDEIHDRNKDLERRVSQRTMELEEVNRELETFSYSVSHDLRAPLRHLDGFSRILQQEYGAKLPEEAQHYLERIRSAATHMSGLVEDLLQLSRIGRQPPQRRRCVLRVLVDEARAEASRESGGRKIVWQIYSLPEVEVDPQLLRQVLGNLFSNAVKFTRQQRTAVIEVGSLEENGMNVVFVRDNGVGFDPHYADKLFGVFQKLHSEDEFEGTGTGLAAVQRIIHKHGGRVWAESQLQQGATFYFSLPVCAHSSRELEEIIGAIG